MLTAATALQNAVNANATVASAASNAQAAETALGTDLTKLHTDQATLATDWAAGQPHHSADPRAFGHDQGRGPQ